MDPIIKFLVDTYNFSPESAAIFARQLSVVGGENAIPRMVAQGVPRHISEQVRTPVYQYLARTEEPTAFKQSYNQYPGSVSAFLRGIESAPKYPNQTMDMGPVTVSNAPSLRMDEKSVSVKSANKDKDKSRGNSRK